MQPHSDAFGLYTRFPNQVVTTVEWRYGLSPWLPLTWYDGSVTCDRKSVTRWSSNITISKDHPITDTGLGPYGAQYRIRRGIRIPRVGVEFVDWGVYRVEKAAPGRTRTTLTGYSMEKQIVDTRFVFPRRIGGYGVVDSQGITRIQGGTYREVIQSLVLEAIPEASFAWRNPDVDDDIASFIEERDRWKVLDQGAEGTSIAPAIGGEMYFDGRGVFVVGNTPSVGDPVAWVIDDNDYPVIVDLQREVTRESVYNLVVATGQTSDGKPPVGPGFAWDNNKSSPTYAGPNPAKRPELSTRANGVNFGVVPRFYSSPLLKTVSACTKAARSIVAESIGLNKSLNFEVVANPALEPGDVVMVDGERHIIDSWTCGLRDAKMTCNTRASKDAIGDVSIQTDVA